MPEQHDSINAERSSTGAERKGMLLARFMAGAGVGSRRHCERLITAGFAEVNGRVVTRLPTIIDPVYDSIAYDGRILSIAEKRYLLVHKPKGYVCSANDRWANKLVYDLISDWSSKRLFSVGRLDKDSEGLLLFTNDGDLANRLLHPRYQVEKCYCVVVSGRVAAPDLKVLETGIVDAGDILRAKSARVIKRNAGGATLEITVREGKKREIRRMCRYLGLRTRRLLRTRFGPLHLGKFIAGHCRELTRAEVSQLKSAVRICLE